MISTTNSQEPSDLNQDNQQGNQDHQDGQQVKNYSQSRSQDYSQNDSQEVAENLNPNSDSSNSFDDSNFDDSEGLNSSDAFDDPTREGDDSQSQATVKQLQIKIMELYGQLEVWKQKTETLLEKVKKQQADIGTINKQHQLDLEATQKKVKKSIVLEIVDFLNTLNISFTFVPSFKDGCKEESVEKFINTLKGSFDKLIQDLEKQNVFIILPKVGQEFDPKTMSPLQNSNQEDTTIKNIVSLGIRLGNQVIKPAVVIL